MSTVGHADVFPEGTFFKGISHGGTGCQAGTVRAELSPEQSTVLISFDEFVANPADRESGRVRVSCNAGVSVYVPQGYRVAIAAIQYRGHVYVPYKGKAQFNVSHYYPDTGG